MSMECNIWASRQKGTKREEKNEIPQATYGESAKDRKTYQQKSENKKRTQGRIGFNEFEEFA